MNDENMDFMVLKWVWVKIGCPKIGWLMFKMTSSAVLLGQFWHIAISLDQVCNFPLTILQAALHNGESLWTVATTCHDYGWNERSNGWEMAPPDLMPPRSWIGWFVFGWVKPQAVGFHRFFKKWSVCHSWKCKKNGQKLARVCHKWNQLVFEGASTLW